MGVYASGESPTSTETRSNAPQMHAGTDFAINQTRNVEQSTLPACAPIKDNPPVSRQLSQTDHMDFLLRFLIMTIVFSVK